MTALINDKLVPFWMSVKYECKIAGNSEFYKTFLFHVSMKQPTKCPFLDVFKTNEKLRNSHLMISPWNTFHVIMLHLDFMS